MASLGPAPVPSHARQHAAQRRRRRRRTRLVARALLVGVLALVVGAGTFVAGLLNAPIDFQRALAPTPAAAILLAADGRQFATIEPPEKREEVKGSDIPQVMREAIMSAEDERFLKHNGVDPLATMRALFRDLTGGNTQGGSTLTQQYVKNAYVGNERTAMRKIREAALAFRLEQKLSKQQILTDYLNALYLGNGLYGVQAASKYYFGVQVKDLDYNVGQKVRDPILALARASLMAGIAPAPSAWNPIADFRTARVRQQYTLNRMVVNGYISAEQATKAYRVYTKRSTIQQNTPPVPVNPAPEFTDYVVPKIKADPRYDEDTFFRGGIRVKTTLDLDLNTAFQQAQREVLPDGSEPQSALVAVDYRNGEIRAMSTLRRQPAVTKDGKVLYKAVTGYQRNGFNLATNALRSTGSTIKTFTLATALSNGYSLDDTLPGPVQITIKCACKGGSYVLHNAGDGEGGRSYTLRNALANSINTVYVPLANKVGRDKVARLAEHAGLAPLPPDKHSLEGRSGAPANFLSFGIGGGADVTPLAEAVAYGTLANGGVHVSPRSFTEIRTGAAGTNPGQVLFTTKPSGLSRVVSSKVADQVVSALKDVVAFGTATSVQAAGVPVFGKTGTTNNSTDAWFTGCVPSMHVCIASWMGYEYTTCTLGSGATLQHVDGACGGMHDLGGVSGQIYGGTLPARIFTRALQIYSDIKKTEALKAAGVDVSATPSPTPHVRSTHRVTPRTTAAASRTPAPKPTATAKPKPTPVRTTPPPIIVPPTQPPPQPSPSPT